MGCDKVAREYKDYKLPLIISGTLHCMNSATREKCEHRSEHYSMCKKKGEDIARHNGERAPIWCPLKLKACFPG